MRLLNASTHKFQEYIGGDVPEYAILSHTWGEGEVTFNDMRPEALPETWKAKPGWDKIEKCCLQALDDSIQFVWADTCCIDKSSSAELQEAINSMFRWYAGSAECYVFLADFEADFTANATTDAMQSLGSARWWTRGWTLQELLAPESVRFFDSRWREFGNKVSLRQTVSSITGISEATLLGTVVGARQTLDRISVAQRMSWAASRQTTRAEDMAYSLLGVFGVNMPMLYGEGGPAAFYRLQVEIMGSAPDQSLLAWGYGRDDSGLSLWGVSNALATSPADFSECGGMLAWGVAKPGDTFTMTQRGLHLRLPVVLSLYGDNLIYCALNCTVTERVPEDADARAARVLAVPFLRPQTRADGLQPHVDEYYRLMARMPLWVERPYLEHVPRMDVHVPRVFTHSDPGQSAYKRLRVEIDLGQLPSDWYVAGMFPPEKSRNDCIYVPFSASDSLTFSGEVVIHIANSSRDKTVSDFVLVIGYKQSANDQGNLIQTPEASVRSPPEHLLAVKESLTPATLRERVFRVIADVMQVDIQTLSEEVNLRELGVGSLESLEIRSELARALQMEGENWFRIPSFLPILAGVVSIGDITRQLRFVTRPSFVVVGDHPTSLESSRQQSLGLRVPRVSIDEVRYRFAEVPNFFSLVNHGPYWSGLHGHWKKLQRSPKPTFIQTPVEGFSIGIKM